jgi:hypothetical protein
LVGAVAFAACWLPAHRAAAFDLSTPSDITWNPQQKGTLP